MVVVLVYRQPLVQIGKVEAVASLRPCQQLNDGDSGASAAVVRVTLREEGLKI